MYSFMLQFTMNDPYFLGEGPLTSFEESVIRKATEFQTTGIEYLLEILTFLSKIPHKTREELGKERFEKEHLTRSAGKIIRDNYCSSCTDYGLVFSSLARYKSIQTKFQHYIDINQFKITPANISAHVFCESRIANYTLFIDPSITRSYCKYRKRN